MISIKGIHHTPLQEPALMRVVKRYWRSPKRPMVIRFHQSGSKLYGCHKVNADGHDVYINVTRCRLRRLWRRDQFRIRKDRDWVAWLLSTLLHELRHAQQYEQCPRKYWRSGQFSLNENCTGPDSRDYFSPCEADARAYENSHIVAALDLYYQHVV